MTMNAGQSHFRRKSVSKQQTGASTEGYWDYHGEHMGATRKF